jgi:hypothetical protein
METPTHWPWPSDVRGLWKSNPLGGPSILNKPLFREMRQARKDGEVAAAQAWRDAAILDGWDARPTYKHEGMNRAFSLERDGWLTMGLARPGDDEAPPLPNGMITVYAPDKLQVLVPIVYPGMDVLASMARRCDKCERMDVDTRRVGFANRVCADCHPEMQAAIETPGWCD